MCSGTFKTCCFVILFVFLYKNTEGKTLRVLDMISMTGTRWPGGPSCIAPNEMAIEDVNSNPNVLADYNLTYDITDSKVLVLNYLYFNEIAMCCL